MTYLERARRRAAKYGLSKEFESLFKSAKRYNETDDESAFYALSEWDMLDWHKEEKHICLMDEDGASCQT